MKIISVIEFSSRALSIVGIGTHTRTQTSMKIDLSAAANTFRISLSPIGEFSSAASSTCVHHYDRALPLANGVSVSANTPQQFSHKSRFLPASSLLNSVDAASLVLEITLALHRLRYQICYNTSRRWRQEEGRETKIKINLIFLFMRFYR